MGKISSPDDNWFRMSISLSVIVLCLNFPAGCSRSNVIPAFTITEAIAVADLNRDGFPDIVTAGSYVADSPPHPGHLAVILQDRENPGKFTDEGTYSIGSDPQCVAAGDLNQDGYTDLVGANYNDGTISLLMQNPAAPGTFIPSGELPTGLYQYDVMTGDLNGDGLADIAVAGTYGVLFFNDPLNPGNFTETFIDTYIYSFAIGDIDGDGRMDLAAIADGDVVIMLQSPFPTDPGQFTSVRTYSAGEHPNHVVIRDLDGDGRNDLAVANHGPGDRPPAESLSILIQSHVPEQPGLFLPARHYQADGVCYRLAIGDLNNDNRLDIVTANGGSFYGGTVSVLLQSAESGVFLPAVNYGEEGQQLDVAIGDLNNDGFNDIAVADADGARVRFQDPDLPGTFLKTILIPN